MASSVLASASHRTVSLPDIPELYDPNFLDRLVPVTQGDSTVTLAAQTIAETPKNMLMEALKGTSHQALTENLAPTYNSTLSATLDAFQSLSSAYNASSFNSYLTDAWTEDPQLTLRIIWNIRSIHDGKGDKELFYKAFGWLYENHPRTAIHNLSQLVEPVCMNPKKKEGMAHGYWKDLLNILALATVDELGFIYGQSNFLHAPREKYQYRHSKNQGGEVASLTRDAEDKKKAQEKRVALDTKRYANLVQKLSQTKFRALFIAVARLFSDRLARDLHIFEELEALGPDEKQKRGDLLRQLSLAAKWAPTPQGSHDRHTNIATAIALLLRHSQTPSIYPSALNKPLDPQESAFILRSYFQRWVLTRLRSTLAVAEPLMSSNRWNEIKYTRVPSVCMKNNMERFFMHDRVRFQAYLTSVEKGKKKISGATLFPHELVREIIKLGSPVNVEEGHEFKNLKELQQSLNVAMIRTVEAQWKALIDRLRESGSLDNALAICDVSGSMGHLSSVVQQRKGMKHRMPPILPAISLSLVLASLAKPPFNGGFVTFSVRPQFVRLDLTKKLFDTVHSMAQSDWGMNTDLKAVFLKLLLPLAVKNKVPKEEMIKRLFVFSDMQFDSCSAASKDPADWKTNHDVIEEAYRAAGYDMPQIVYWDLASYGTVEVQSDREGVALMNGFSPSMLKVFMGESEPEEWEEVGEDGESKTVKVKGEFNPVNVMKRALMVKSLDGLVVMD
ncbi:hypothetical protein H0H92_009793 [Tricholoma furcatifolium]|nr:hypothetical protein H0H92_009793 [Tricholoma furcatifolium]